MENNGKESLYALTQQYDSIMNAFIEDPDNFDLALALSEVDASIEDKADAYSVVMDRLEAEEAGFDAQKKVYNTKAKESKASADSCKASRERMNESLKQAMQLTGKSDGFTTGMHRYWIGGVGGKQALIYDKTVVEFISDAGFFDDVLAGISDVIASFELSDCLIPKIKDGKIIIDYDEAAIREAIKAGEHCEVAHLAEKKEKVKYK